MATVRYVKLVIKRSVMEGIARTVPLFEAPVLEAVHGSKAIENHGEIEREVDAPDVIAEFNRLARLYGMHDSGVAMVEYVYGRPTTGALEKAIDASIVKPRRRSSQDAATA